MPGRSWYCRRPALAAQLSAGPSRARCVSVQTHRYSKAPKVLPSHKAGVLTDSFANLINSTAFFPENKNKHMHTQNTIFLYPWSTYTCPTGEQNKPFPALPSPPGPFLSAPSPHSGCPADIPPGGAAGSPEAPASSQSAALPRAGFQVSRHFAQNSNLSVQVLTASASGHPLLAGPLLWRIWVSPRAVAGI